MKKIIAELDKIAQYLEDTGETWAYSVLWRLDKVSQSLEQHHKTENKFKKISKNVLNQYLDNMIFLSENNDKLRNLIHAHNLNNDASNIYEDIKKHFGSLSKEESLDFIKNNLKSFK